MKEMQSEQSASKEKLELQRKVRRTHMSWWARQPEQKPPLLCSNLRKLYVEQRLKGDGIQYMYMYVFYTGADE